MTNEQKTNLLEGIFEYFKLKLPTNILTLEVIYKRLDNKTWDFSCEAYVEMTMRQGLKASKPNELMDAFEVFYRDVTQKYTPRLPEPKYSYQLITTCKIRPFDSKDKRSRKNEGRSLALFNNLLHFKYIKITAGTSLKNAFELIKTELVELINSKEKNNEFEIDDKIGGLLIIDLQKIAPHVQSMLNRTLILTQGGEQLHG